MNRLHMARLDRESGVSLIELMIGLVVGLVILFGIIETMMVSKSASQTQQSMSAISENARFAFEFMNRDLRMAGYGCTARCDWTSKDADGNEVDNSGPYITLDANGVLIGRHLEVIPATGNKTPIEIRYQLVNGELLYTKRVGDTVPLNSEVLIDGLAAGAGSLGVSFGVFDTGTETLQYKDAISAGDNIVSVRITLRFVDGSGAGNTLDFDQDISTTIALRNPLIKIRKKIAKESS